MASELTLLILLFQMICVIVVFAYLATRARPFTEILDGKFNLKNYLFLILFFGALSLYGTASGTDILGAHINVRDLGPIIGGLVGGPIVGLGAGLIGSAYRYSQGGVTVIACTLATLLAGLFAGIVYYGNKKRFIGLRGAVLFVVLMEVFHMALLILTVQPISLAMEIVSAVAIPMIVSNGLGMFFFAFIITNLIQERKTEAERDAYRTVVEREKAEMQIAHEIQTGFLPKDLPAISGVDLAGASLPAREVGGDFYDFVKGSNGETAFVIADVSGKGVPAALFMVLSRTIVKANATWHHDARTAIQDANAMIANDAESGMFVTLLYGVLNPETMNLTYVNAGHNPPVLFRRDGTLEHLNGTGIALGVMEDAEYQEATVTLAPGDVLVCYTDGVTEAINGDEEQFGEARFCTTVQECQDRMPDEIISTIIHAVNGFCGDEPQFDDMTLVVLKVDG
ncbi:MAG: SpoIIE family protein phosphatase [Methanomicrobiaceae archaeon]|nr:SpoIIE family protein phosphatase [Methanomicrobiaceae archaeon]